MASASGTFCGVCETQYVVKEAVIWCPECDKGLCLSCEKHHQASKASKIHEITSVKDYRQIPSSITSITQYCSDHEKRYQLYCSQHEKLCCPLCISRNHKTCELVAIDDIVKKSKTSALFDIMEQSLQDMKGNIGRIVEDRKLNMEKIQQQRQTFQTDIQKIRDKINKHLDKLENEIQQDIQAAEKKVQSQIERLLSTFYDHEKSLDELQKNILATKSFATDLQTFLGGKMLEAEIQRKEMIMQSLIEDGSLQQIKLQCIIDDKISDILSITKFGEISILANPPTITLTMTRDKQAQQMVQTISKTINDINPTLFEIVKGGITSGITGCTVMPTGQMVFVDNDNNRLVIHNENGLIDFEIPVARRPVDVTCIAENTVAVTHHEWIYYIEIINIANKTIVKRIKTSNVCYGITNNNGKLIYYETGSGILTVDVNHESSITTVVKVDDKQHWNYVTAAKDKIYHTNPVTDTVTCYTVTGQKVWEKTNQF
ncbi:nuclear factor 7, brain-like [Mytilus trossulus]|uniref:nuclear factor 7, brain-like n=1 Tax=Mytilus trossulus TaxID=6551 RepID=UPI0030043D60